MDGQITSLNLGTILIMVGLSIVVKIFLALMLKVLKTGKTLMILQACKLMLKQMDTRALLSGPIMLSLNQ